MSGAKLLISIGFVILVGSILLVLYNDIQPLPWNVSLILPLVMVVFMMFIIVGSGLMWFDTSWVTRSNRQQQPYEPDDNTVVRVVKTDNEKGEYFVYGNLDDSVRKAVERDWPFDKELRSKNWHVLNEEGDDVTDRLYIEVEGTLRVVFA